MDIKMLVDKLMSNNPSVTLSRQEKDFLLDLLKKTNLREDWTKHSIQVATDSCPCCGKN